MSFTEQEIHTTGAAFRYPVTRSRIVSAHACPAWWESQPWRPSGRNESAIIPPRLDLLPQIAEITAGQLSVAAFQAGQALTTGADTIRDALNLLPAGLGAYGSYRDNFGGFPELLAMRARLGMSAVYFSYTIFGNSAHFADVEPGAMHPASAARWLRDGRGVPLPGNTVPGVYTSSGNADMLFDAVGLGNLPHDQLPPDFIYQSAHYGAGPHICGPRTCGFRQAHGTQWDDKGPGGQNYDRALWLPGVLGRGVKPVTITIPEDQDMLAMTTDTNGLIHVCAFVPHAKDDATKGGTIYEIYQNGQHSWAGGEQGKQKALAYPLVKIPENVG